MHFEVRALDRLRTRRRVGSTRRRGNHMHDPSRFQRDINDVTGVSLSLLLLTKVTDAQYRKRFGASYNNNDWSVWRMTFDFSSNLASKSCRLVPGWRLAQEKFFKRRQLRVSVHCSEWRDMHTEPHGVPPAKAYNVWVCEEKKRTHFSKTPNRLSTI